MEDQEWIIVKPPTINQFFLDCLFNQRIIILQLALYALRIDWRFVMAVRAVWMYKKYNKYIWWSFKSIRTLSPLKQKWFGKQTII